MSKLKIFDLISGIDIPYEDIGTLHQPTLDEIRKVGFDQYINYTNILLMDIEKYLERDDVDDVIKEEIKSKYTMFDIWFSQNDGRALLQKALSFFMCEDIMPDLVHHCYVLFKDGEVVGLIDKANFDNIVSGIGQINYIQQQEVAPINCKNNRAKKILEKLVKGRKEAAKHKKADLSINIPNLISSIVAYHGTYNYENIWSLTIYQLYDLFFRLSTKNQLSVMGLRWAAWGKDDFDFGVWYKDPNLK